MNYNDDDFQMPEIDRIVHEPARLAILTVLSTCEEADFLFLECATKLSRGNLSVQLTRLENAGVIEIEKRIEHKRMLTHAEDAVKESTDLVKLFEGEECINAVLRWRFCDPDLTTEKESN